MKFFYTSLIKLSCCLFAFCIATVSHAQYVIFSEDMGDTSATGTISIAQNHFQNFENGTIAFSGTGDTRTTTPSTDYANASGGREVFLTNSNPTTTAPDFVISGINIKGATNISVSLGIQKSTIAEDGNGLEISATVDGGSQASLTAVMQAGAGTTKWQYITLTGTVPTGNLLTLSFARKQTTTTTGVASFRLDDINIASVTPVPIILDSFSAEKSISGALLKWSTKTEINSSRFEILKSTDGKIFSTIGAVAALNNPAGARYSYTDNNYNNGTAYYRLNMIDLDGAQKLGNIVVIGSGASGIERATLLNTIVKDKLGLNTSVAGSLNVRIFNVSGKLLQQQTVYFGSAGRRSIDPGRLPQGVYFVQLSMEGWKETFRIIRQ